MNESTSNAYGQGRGADLTGSQLGDYRLLRRLGRGAMAEVYLAEQCSLKRQVAVKVLKRELAADETYIKRFRMEAQAAAALVHPHIVHIHEVGCIDGVHFIVQEYVRGPNLSELLDRRGPLDAALAITIMRQTASALSKAAEVGIVHRDIKPENVMLTADGDVKVADFGLARLVGDGTTRLTQVGVTMGTPLYMSPEQIEGRPLDHRSDIYSFGVTCYHMLNGSPPFEGDTVLSVAVQHLKKQPEPLDNLRPDLPGALCRIVHRMLAKAPEERYADARQLFRDLHSLQAEGAEDANLPKELLSDLGEPLDTIVTARTAATQHLTTVMAQQRERRRRLAIFAAMLAAAFLIGCAVAWIARPQFLLAGVNARRPQLEKKSTALAQYIYASTISTEEAWKSVQIHFPDESYWVRRAEQQLARHYLWDEQYKSAMKLFEKFAGLDEAEEEFRAFGMAGMCIVLSIDKHYNQSADILVELMPLRDALPADMAGILQQVMERNRQALGAPTPREWQEFFDTLPTGQEG